MGREGRSQSHCCDWAGGPNAYFHWSLAIPFVGGWICLKAQELDIHLCSALSHDPQSPVPRWF